MPLQNRVTPFGEITKASWRGAWTGNRGCLHDGAGELGVRRWRHQNWVCCQLEFRGRKRDPMPPNRWTALFFWDEAVALTAGHRPCGECRYKDYQRFMAAWRTSGLPGANPREVDKHLHRHRVTRTRAQVRYTARPADLPDGTFFMVPEGEHMPMLWWGGAMHHLSLADGRYYDAGLAPDSVAVLTPKPMLEVLRAGYVPDTRLMSRDG
ncbi:MAG: hypothetical protein AB8B85_16925 [Paracoccaceae bacterium]